MPTEQLVVCDKPPRTLRHTSLPGCSKSCRRLHERCGKLQGPGVPEQLIICSTPPKHNQVGVSLCVLEHCAMHAQPARWPRRALHDQGVSGFCSEHYCAYGRLLEAKCEEQIIVSGLLPRHDHVGVSLCILQACTVHAQLARLPRQALHDQGVSVHNAH